MSTITLKGLLAAMISSAALFMGFGRGLFFLCFEDDNECRRLPPPGGGTVSNLQTDAEWSCTATFTSRPAFSPYGQWGWCIGVLTQTQSDSYLCGVISSIQKRILGNDLTRESTMSYNRIKILLRQH